MLNITRDLLEVEIIGAPDHRWYSGMIGERFDVVRSLHAGWYVLAEDAVNGSYRRHIHESDCSVVPANQPESDAATGVSDTAMREAHDFLKQVDQPGVTLAGPDGDRKVTSPAGKSLAHPLDPVFDAAISQLTSGKGNERHGNGAAFLEQPWVSLTEGFGIGGPMFQASKKLRESMKFYHAKEYDRFEREVLGALNYAAMAVLHARKEKSQ